MEDLRQALEAGGRSGGPAEPPPPPGAAAFATGGLVHDILARHGHSTQPESQQVVAILRAVLDILQSESLPATPTALFAALMASLEKPETLVSNEVRLRP